MQNNNPKEDLKVRLDYDLYSFDVFDTLITRKTATPKGIFAIIQKKLQSYDVYNSFPSNIIANFYILRVQSEQYLKAIKRLENTVEITLDEIYDFWAKNFGLSKQERDILLNLEIQTEKENLIPIEQNLNILKNLISKGKNVILISDIYLNAPYLKDILNSVDSVFNSIELYCSADIKKTKQVGTLYEYIKEKKNIKYDKWIHFGDNSIADIRNAKKLNINTFHVKTSELKDYEKFVLNKDETNVFVQYTIGAARNARLFQVNNNAKEELGISLAGPMLFPYVYWLLEQAVRRNINRLYFIARDGYVLQKIANILIAKLNLEIKTKYIYGSREAWRLPCMMIDRNTVISYIFNEKWFIKTVEDIAQRFNVSLNEFYKILPVKYKNYKKLLTDEDLEIIRNALCSNESFLTKIQKDTKQKRELLIEYIKQEIDFSDNNFAFVDLQGSGITQKLLCSVLAEFTGSPINCFYSRLSISPKTDNDKYANIFIEFPNKNYLHFIRELFCRALHGQTIGYKKFNNKIIPVFEGNAEALIKWGYQNFIDGIEKFSKQYLENINIELPLSDLKIFLNYYTYVLHVKNKEIAELLGSMPFSYVGREDDINQCAPPYTLHDFWYPNTRRTIPMFSMLRSSKNMQKLMNFRQKYPKLLHYFIFGHINRKKNIAMFRFLGIEISFRQLLWGKK